jgi:hypothetical protein
LRRTLLALTALASLLVVLATGGSGALGSITTGPLSASPANMGFGHVAQGVPQTITETLTNNGSQPLNIQSVQVSGPDQGDFNLSNNTCTSTQSSLNVGDSCSVDVTFAPSGTGSETASLDITDDDTTDGNQQSQDLNGIGVNPEFSLGGGLTFPDTVVGGTSQTQSILVANNTDYADSPPNITLGGSDPSQFSLDASGCNVSVGGNGNCSVNVTFEPTSAGQQNATVNMGGQSVPVTGTGTQANANVAPSSISFGSQPVATDSGATDITLTNNGTAPLTYGSTTVGGANPGDFPVSDADCITKQTLAPGAQCTITADFVPVAAGGRSATLTVHDGDPNNPTQTVSLSGTGTPSSVGFSPATVTFVNPVVAGLASPVHGVKITNATSKSMPITAITIAGANPKSFIRSADTCTGTTLAAGASCSIHVEFAPTAAGHRSALLQVSDTGPIAPHTHVLTLTGTATSPNNPKAVRGAVGCQSSQISWVPPSATRFAGVWVVRNHAHYPTSIVDGTVVPRSDGVATDKRLKHFATYYYRVFARYHSTTRAAQINYSAGVKLKLRTGQICTPRNGARISDLTPKFTWLPSATQNGYAFVLQHGETNIDVRYAHRTSYQLPSSWKYNKGHHRLVEGGTYTFFLFAYPKTHPKGILIGQTTFFVK